MGAALPTAFERLIRMPEVAALVAACAGGECHLVGGALRDAAIGLASHDLDAVVAGDGAGVARRLAERLGARVVALGGKELAAFRTLRIVAGGVTIDLWDRAGTSLVEDLARRDFTVNSFALDPASRMVTDPFGGRDDVAARALRATTPASFLGDPLRVLRLSRLLAVLPGFRADPATVSLAARAASRLPEVAGERIREELRLLFEHPRAATGFAVLAETGAYPSLWLAAPGPEGRATSGMHGEVCAAAEVAPGLAALDESAAELAALDQAAAGAADLHAVRLALTLLPLDGPRPTAAHRSPRSASLPGREARRASEDPAAGALIHLRRFAGLGYLTREREDAVACLLREVDYLLDLDSPGGEDREARDGARRRLLFRQGSRWPSAACLLGALAIRGGRRESWRRELGALVELVRREGANLLAPPRLLTGEEIQQALGIGPGPEVGRTLAELTAAQVAGTVRSREEALRWLSERTQE